MSFHIYFSGLLHLSLLTVLCLDQNHSNICKYMPKYIVYFCVALHSLFVLDKISFVVPFPHSQRELVCANWFPCDGNTCPFVDRTGICSILLMYVYLWSVCITFFKWIICHSIVTLSSFSQLNSQILGWSECLSTVHEYLQNNWVLLKNIYLRMLIILQYYRKYFWGTESVEMLRKRAGTQEQWTQIIFFYPIQDTFSSVVIIWCIRRCCKSLTIFVPVPWCCAETDISDFTDKTYRTYTVKMLSTQLPIKTKQLLQKILLSELCHYCHNLKISPNKDRLWEGRKLDEVLAISNRNDWKAILED